MKDKKFVDYFKNSVCNSCSSKLKGCECIDIDECSNGYDSAFEAGYELAKYEIQILLEGNEPIECDQFISLEP